jgi:putative transcriptional regulator
VTEPLVPGGAGPGVSHAGRLLVAVPPSDPLFARTVVLVLDHDEAGALGLILNRPGDLQVAEVLPEWADAVVSPPVLFLGGPVTPEGAVCLGRSLAPESELPATLRPVGGGLCLVDLGSGAGGPAGLPLDRLRVYAGYSGWSPGQLDAEVAAGAWFVVDLLPGDPWSQAPELLWRDVLRRQAGPMRLLSTFPPDPALN